MNITTTSLTLTAVIALTACNDHVNPYAEAMAKTKADSEALSSTFTPTMTKGSTLAEVIAGIDARVTQSVSKINAAPVELVSELNSTRANAGVVAMTEEYDFVTHNQSSYEHRGVRQGGAKDWRMGCSPYCDSSGGKTKNSTITAAKHSISWKGSKGQLGTFGSDDGSISIGVNLGVL